MAIYKNKEDGRFLETDSVLFGIWEAVKPEKSTEAADSSNEAAGKESKKDSKK